MNGDASSTPAGFPPQDTDASYRPPVLFMLLSAAAWLATSSVFALIASIKFHSPEFLAGIAWLTYGRVRPVASCALLYGFGIQAGLGVMLWLFASQGRTALRQGWAVVGGALLWNVGVALGVLAILAGGSTGFQTLEMPRHAGLLMFLGYLIIGMACAIAFHRRTPRDPGISRIFLFAALFWFPWIFPTANLLLLCFPVRGMAQGAIAWWYAENLQMVWVGLAGLGVGLHFLPRLVGRELSSHHLPLIVFWMLVLVGGWGGIPPTAPLPAWMPALSTVASVLMSIAATAVALTVHGTVKGSYKTIKSQPLLLLTSAGLLAFVATIVMKVIAALTSPGLSLGVTWFEAARLQSQTGGFLPLVLFAGMYHIAPRLVGAGLPYPRLVRVQAWLAVLGVFLGCVPLAIGGLVQASRLSNPAIAFGDVVKSTLPFLRVSTVGDVLLLAASILFLLNLGALAACFYRARAKTAVAVATADLFAPTQAKP
jgi:cytochrome c oxidase cbb3-type subunit 1